MALTIPPGIAERTSYLMVASLAELGASFSELIEVGDFDGWLVYLWKTIARGVSTAIMVVTTRYSGFPSLAS